MIIQIQFEEERLAKAFSVLIHQNYTTNDISGESKFKKYIYVFRHFIGISPHKFNKISNTSDYYFEGKDINLLIDEFKILFKFIKLYEVGEFQYRIVIEKNSL